MNLFQLLTPVYQIFGSADITALVTNFFGVIADNALVVLGLTGTMFGVAFVMKLLRKGQKGRI